jgi:glycosyltransferase involved in cell wall biosynthesis
MSGEDREFFEFMRMCRDSYRKLGECIHEVVGAQATALDLGCGVGGTTGRLKELGWGVKGMEYSPDARALAEPGLEVLPLDLMAVPPEPEVVDCVVCTETAEHIDPAYADTVVDNVVLRAKGLIVFSAAQPGQEYEGHVNLQPIDYWVEKFWAKGFAVSLPETLKLRELMVAGRAQHWAAARNFLVLRRRVKRSELVTVVVPCHKQPQYLAECLDSVRAQTYPHVEVIVACGDDESFRVASRECVDSRNRSVFTSLSGLVKGLADARNRAIALATGEYVVCLDADDTIEPTFIEKLLESTTPGALSVATCNMQEFGDRSGVRFIGLGKLSDELEANYLLVCSLFSRKLWELVGGYENSLFGYEDWNFWVQCTKHDFSYSKVEQPLFRYRVHASQGSKFCEDNHEVLRAAIRLINRGLYDETLVESDMRLISTCSDEVAKRFLERAEWFPDNAHVRVFAALIGENASTRARLLEESESTLLCVSMILKDEAHCIRKTIDSCRDIVDKWVVLDTGSTDGTQDVLRKELGDKLELHEEPFVNFSVSRNRALDLCGRASEYILMLSADEIVENPAVLRQFLATRRSEKGLQDEAYMVEVFFKGATNYKSARVLRSWAKWRYVGATHEVLCRPGGNPDVATVKGSRIVFTGDSKNEGSKKFERDIALLSKEVEADPSNSRSWFYLGLSHYWAGNYLAGFRALERRVALGGWNEEVFYAKLAKARCATSMGLPWKTCLELYLEAHSVRPHRAEPLADVARHYHEVEDHASCVLFASRAFALPYPDKDVLFVEKAVYDWMAADYVAVHCFYLEGRENHDLGLRAALHAQGALPHDPRLQANANHYLARELE